jgi:hypothetical protein
LEKTMSEVKSPNLLQGLTDKQLSMRPMCHVCGWRKGGLDSWDGVRCKCGHNAPTFREVFTEKADRHEAEAERLDALDNGGDCEVAASFHATRASEVRAAISKATSLPA